MALYSALAVLAGVLAVIMKNETFTWEETEDGFKSNDEILWIVFSTFLNAIAAAILTQFFMSIADWIAIRENHKQQSDFEESLIR